jgi:hypothetical protein
MADISLIIDVQQKGVVKAVKDTKALENNAKLLSKAFKAGDLSQRQYYKGIAQLSKETKRSETELKTYANTIRRVEADTKKAKIAQDAERLAVQQYTKARRDATATNARFDAEQKKAARTAKEVARANRSLRMEFKQGHAAMVQLRATQMRLSRAFRQGVIDADQYKLGMDRLGVAAGRAGRHMNRSGVLVQQTGYQVGDFLVQVQSGTNALVAFGQQATQIAGTLTILGGKWILIGTALGITIPLLTAVGAYFMRTAKDARETSGSVETLDDKIKSLNKTVEDWLTTRRAASMGITVEELLGVQNIQSAQQAVDAARVELQDLISQTQSNASSVYSPRAGGDRNRLAADLGDLINEQVIATKKLFDAEKLLADLERKNALARFANFRSEAVELSAQLNVRRAIDKFGRDSAQVRAVELSNSTDSSNRQIQAQVRSNDLTQIQADILIRLNTELLTSEASYETMLDNQSRIKSGAEILVTVWGNLKKIVTDAANESGRFADNLVLGQGYLDAAVRSGVSSGAIPPQALQDLPQTPSEEAMEKILADRRAAANASGGSSGGSGGGASTIKETALEKLQKELDLADELYGKTEEFMHVRKALGEEWATTSQSEIDRLMAQYKATEDLIDLDQERASLATSMANSLGDGYTAMVEGTLSVKDAFRSMAKDIIKQLWDVLVMQRLIGSVGTGGGVGATGIAGFLGGLLGFDGGGYTGSGPRSGGMDGKGGFMAMLHPQETVVDHTKGQSSGGQSVVINQSFNFSANGDDTVKRLIAQAAPQIAKMTKSSMLDDRRRGGATKAAFG